MRSRHPDAVPAGEAFTALALAALALVALASLGCGGLTTHGGSVGSGGGGPLYVSSTSSLVYSNARTVFVVAGSGFRSAGPGPVTVRLTASSGTPFAGGTRDTAEVYGTPVRDQALVVTSPDAGTAFFTALVEVVLADGRVATSPGPVLQFGPLASSFPFQRVGTPGSDTLSTLGPFDTAFYALAGNDVMYGSFGDDHFVGDEGNDHIDTGGGRSQVVLIAGQPRQHDTVTGFYPSSDVLIFDEMAPPNHHALLALVGGVTDTGPGGDVVITWGPSSTLTIHGRGKGRLYGLIDLLLDDWVFVVMP